MLCVGDFDVAQLAGAALRHLVVGGVGPRRVVHRQQRIAAATDHDGGLAAQIAAEQYLRHTGANGVALRASPDTASETLAELQAGDMFDVLELAGINAWGVAPGSGLVGYIPASALAAAAK